MLADQPTKETKKPAQQSLLSSSTVVSAMTLLSRMLGLIRDILIAQLLGAGSSADAFFVAFKVPNFLRRLFAEGAFSQAFVPVLSEYQRLGKLEVRQLLSPVIGVLGGVTFFLCLVAIIFAPAVVWIVAPGFSESPDKMALTTTMMRFTFPYLFFVSVMACASGVLNTYKVFAPSAFAPVLLNLCLIGALVFISPLLSTPAMALAMAVTLAGFLQLLLHLFFLERLQLLVLPRLSWSHPGVKKILVLMAPAIFGVSVSQINLLLDTILASFLADGSVSWLYYADRLIELPLGVFGVAIATVILPHLSSQHTNASILGFKKTLDWGVRWVVMLGVPSAFAMILLAEPILISLFYYGEFALIDVEKSAQALRAYSLALMPFMLIKIFATGFFSRQDTKTPVKIGIIAMVLNMVANLIFVWHFEHVGLALATSVSASINALLLYRGLAKRDVFNVSQDTLYFIIKVLAASTLMISILYFCSFDISFWVGCLFWQRFLALSGIIVLGLTVFFVAIWLLGIRPVHLSEQHEMSVEEKRE